MNDLEKVEVALKEAHKKEANLVDLRPYLLKEGFGDMEVCADDSPTGSMMWTLPTDQGMIAIVYHGAVETDDTDVVVGPWVAGYVN